MRTLFRLPAFDFCDIIFAAFSSRPGARTTNRSFPSPVVTSATPGHAVNVDIDIAGAKQLYLIVTDADDGIGADWADWAEARLVGPSGDKKLSDLKWSFSNRRLG